MQEVTLPPLAWALIRLPSLRWAPRRRWAAALALSTALTWLGALPAGAAAHGPVAPVATSYLARVTRTPAGVDAKVVDGDLRMWVRVPASMTVVIIDYRGAPYLRFSRSGVQVNQNSAMYYINQVPPVTPPISLGPGTAPRWRRVSAGHSYLWQDGRLQALARTVLAPGTSYAGRWSIPLRVRGRVEAITGGLYHSPGPSLVWFWPIVVLLACVLAAWRIRRPALDARVARVLGLVALLGVAVAGTARQLHGRPLVSDFQLVELAAILAFVVWGVRQALLKRPGYFTYFVISLAALWEGIELIPTLTHGFVLVAAPALVARTSAVLCLGAGAGLLPFVFRLVSQFAEPAMRPATDAVDGRNPDPREEVWGRG